MNARTIGLRLSLSLCVLLGSSACALLPNATPPPPPEGLLSTPFWPQQEYQCGPAALASLLNASEVDVTPDDLVPLVYLPERKGSLQTELLAAPRKFSRIGYLLPGTLKALQRTWQTQQASVVLLNLGVSWLPQWHYAVVIGFDEDHIWLNSGEQAQLPIAHDDFLKQWKRANHWAMVVNRPDTVPQALDAGDVLHQLSPLENSHSDLAVRAYRSALQRWPHQDGLAFGLANSLLANGETKNAVVVFSELLIRQPNSSPVVNNLALALAADGQAMKALQLIDQHIQQISLNDPWFNTLNDSRKNILDQHAH